MEVPSSTSKAPQRRINATMKTSDKFLPTCHAIAHGVPHIITQPTNASQTANNMVWECKGVKELPEALASLPEQRRAVLTSAVLENHA